MGAGTRLGVLAVAAAVGIAFDARLFGLRLPTIRRQVNQDWIATYRGWVVGLGFGFQLGMGIVTIVTTSTVYVMLLAAFLSGGAGAGALIAGTFGLARASILLSVAGVKRPEQLGRVDAVLRRWDADAPRRARGGGRPDDRLSRRGRRDGHPERPRHLDRRAARAGRDVSSCPTSRRRP